MVHGQLNIKVDHFTEDKLDTALKTIKSRKDTVVDEILPEN